MLPWEPSPGAKLSPVGRGAGHTSLRGPEPRPPARPLFRSAPRPSPSWGLLLAEAEEAARRAGGQVLGSKPSGRGFESPLRPSLACPCPS